jgi:hypothetical protein
MNAWYKSLLVQSLPFVGFYHRLKYLHNFQNHPVEIDPCKNAKYLVHKKVILFTIDYLGPISQTQAKVNCRLKCFVRYLVTYCYYNNVFVYFNRQPTVAGVDETGP